MTKTKNLADKLRIEKLRSRVQGLVETSNYANKLWQKQVVESYNNIINDPGKKERIKNRKCMCCAYRGPRLAMQAFTRYNCRACEREFNHPNSLIPKLCHDCAEELKLCGECGGKL